MATMIWIGLVTGAFASVALIALGVWSIVNARETRSSSRTVEDGYRSLPKRAQLICGLSAGMLGVILPYVGLRFVLVENGEDPFRWSLWALLAGLPVSIAIIAWVNATSNSALLIGLLWLLSLLLLAFALAGTVTFGFFLMPSALLGIGTSMAATLARRSPSKRNKISAHR